MNQPASTPDPDDRPLSGLVVGQPTTATIAWSGWSDGQSHASIGFSVDPYTLFQRTCSGKWRLITTDTELPVTAAQVRELADLMDAADQGDAFVIDEEGNTGPFTDERVLAAKERWRQTAHAASSEAFGDENPDRVSRDEILF